MIAALGLALLLGAAPSMAEPPLDDPPDPITAKVRATEIGRSLRCPVCQALSVEDSSSEAALAMQARILELVAEGYTDDQIVDYFVDRYGEWVRLAPPAEGLNWLVWLGPLVILGVGGVVVGSRMRSASQTGGAVVASVSGDERQGPGSEQDDPWRARVLAELEDE